MQNQENVSTDFTEEQIEELFGEKVLRWYQIAARNAIAQHLREGINRILVVLPTGSGKTAMVAASMSYQPIREALGVFDDRKLRVLFVAHKHRLLTQAEQAFADSNNVELILQSVFSDIPQNVLDAGWDITVGDEIHHEAASSFQYKLVKLGEHPIVGLTATPDRSDNLLIKFEKIINPISREQAVLEGYLAPTRIHSFVDVFSKEKVEVLNDIFDNFHHQFGQTMLFVKTKKEVTAMTTIISNLGYKAVGLLGQTDKELDQILNQFSAGEIKFVINCNRISEGVDVKGCTDVVVGRQVGSYSALSQIVGRASRPDGGENGRGLCNVWELVNPLSGRNLDTTCIVGTPEYHRLVSKENGVWVEREFNYVTHRTNKQIGITSGVRIRH